MTSVPPVPPVVSDTAPAHHRRVTLNLIRYAACCSDELRIVIDGLADVDWQLDRLEPAHLEYIYATVDEDLAAQALSEYEADPECINDHRGEDVSCQLCGHAHIRFEFKLANIAGGRDHWTGSHCIETYGIVVRGAGTAEEALTALRRAITKARARAARVDWLQEHPDHAQDLDHVCDGVRLRLRSVSTAKWEALGGWEFFKRLDAFVASAKVPIRFYEKEGWLRKAASNRVYGPGGLIAKAAALNAEFDAA